MADPSNITGKVVIDTINPLDFSQGLPPRMVVGVTDSAAEINQRLLPGAKVVKAFNIVGNPHMVHPDFPGGPPTMLICGNDEQAKKMVTEGILTPFGWETIDIGGIEGAAASSGAACNALDYILLQNRHRRSCIQVTEKISYRVSLHQE
jgi:predicted dinucleotide-binding enzyme